MTSPTTILEPRTEPEILATYEVMRQLRPHLVIEEYPATVMRLMEQEGYRLAAVAVAGQVRAVAGYRLMEMLYCGRILYVDDLVTGAIWATSGSVRGDEMPETVSLGLVTDNFFTVLGVTPSLGRLFDRGEEGPSGAGVVLISDAYWRTSLGADPSVVGRSIHLDGREAVIIGVLATDFTLRVPPDAGVPARLDLYTPFPYDLSNLPPDSQFLRVIGRLAPGITWGEAQARVTAVASGVRDRYTELARTGDSFSLGPLQADAVHRVRPILLALLTGVGLFLLLAAGNVASLLIARTNARRREMAIRSCLGASRSRIARQLLTESLVVAAVAGVVGLGLSLWGGQALWRYGRKASDPSAPCHLAAPSSSLPSA